MTGNPQVIYLYLHCTASELMRLVIPLQIKCLLEELMWVCYTRLGLVLYGQTYTSVFTRKLIRLRPIDQAPECSNLSWS